MKLSLSLAAILIASVMSPLALAQNAQLSGLVKDKSDAVIPSATVTLTNIETGAILTAKSGKAGLYVFASVASGRYSLAGEAPGFAKTVVNDIKIDTAAYVSEDIVLQVKGASDTVTVTSAPTQLVETTGAVSTVIDRQLAEDAPLNGRSLQTLFELTPGVVLNASDPTNGGGFSVNGQRPTANYLMIDGASGNIYAPSAGGFNMTGASIAQSASGGTNGLLPIDAVEEFRMQTSTYDASYGRTPGGQIEVKTRSGTNQFHGTLFENFRNQVLDATDWIVGFNHLPQPPLRMNDFGGTFGGPILKNKLFVFVAHETLLMHQPLTTTYNVPNNATRASTAAVLQPFVSAYPIGNDANPAGDGFSDVINQGFSNVIVDHTTSARVDVELPKHNRAFFRINDAPSYITPSGRLQPWTTNVNIMTSTGGITSQIYSRATNDFTVAYSRDKGSNSTSIVALGGNNPNAIMQAAGSLVDLRSSNLFFRGVHGWPSLLIGPQSDGSLSQINVLDALSLTAKSHTIKIGIDFLHKEPVVTHQSQGFFRSGWTNPTELQTGLVDFAEYGTFVSEPHIHLTNVSMYATDTWRALPKLTVDYGLRWDFDPPASVVSPGEPVLVGSPNNISNVSVILSKGGIYKTRYANFAPRFGFTATINRSQKYQMVLRGGAGIFFDTGTAATVNQSAQPQYPFYYFGAPVRNIQYQSLDFESLKGQPATLPQGALYLADANLRSPRAYQWSLTLEQEIGTNSTVAASYVGNRGDQLIKSLLFTNDGTTVNIPTTIISPFGSLTITTNGGRSSYDALQLQAKTRFGTRFEALSSYTFAHALDTSSSDFNQIGALQTDHRANSDNDIRQIFSTVFSYKPSGYTKSTFLKYLTEGWTVSSITQLQSAAPLSVVSGGNTINTNQFQGLADIVPGVPVVLSDSSAPGGRKLNPNAFINAPSDSAGNQLREGTSARNGYRLFGLVQWDLSGSRTWKTWERASLTFRVDAFNIVNHPNFSNVNNSLYIGNTTFGEAQGTYAGTFGGTGADGGLNAVFSNGGPRSLQLAMKLQF